MKRILDKLGFTLLETATYIAVLSVLMVPAYQAMSRVQQNSHRLIDNTQDIARVLKAGEKWRDDIRHASKMPWTKKQDLFITRRYRTVVYRFFEDTVLRRVAPQEKWETILTGVKSSAMQPDIRSKVQAWSWELELQSSKRANMRPLFTFCAVPVNIPANKKEK